MTEHNKGIAVVMKPPSNWRLLLCISMLLPVTASAVQPGSIAVFSDGSVEKFVARNGDREIWEDERLRRITRPVNPLLPPITREPLLGGVDYTQVLQKGNPAVLLSGKKGDVAEFSVWRVRGLDTGSERRYRCTHEGVHSLPVMGKPEQVTRYTCIRFRVSGASWQERIKETRIIDYSPRLEMVVATKRTTPKSDSRRVLVRLMAPAAYSYKALRKELKKPESTGK
jgi:hypothetical protein